MLKIGDFYVEVSQWQQGTKKFDVVVTTGIPSRHVESYVVDESKVKGLLAGLAARLALITWDPDNEVKIDRLPTQDELTGNASSPSPYRALGA